MKVHGVQFTFGDLEKGLWIDDDKPRRWGWGIKLTLAVGRLYRPVPKLWRYRFNAGWENNPNPWKNPNDIWFTLKFPVIVGPFFSLAFRRFGFYVGLKPDTSIGLIPSIRVTFRRRFSI